MAKRACPPEPIIEARSYASLTGKLVGGGVDVYLNVNNNHEGSAPLTIERIRALLERKHGGKVD